MDNQLIELIELLSSIHLFNSLDKDQLMIVADHMGTQLFRENETIFEEGDEADGLYIISSGRVSIIKGYHHHAREISIFQRGDFFGEEGSFRIQKRKVTALAETNLVLFHLSSEQIQAVIDEFPEIEAPIQLATNSFDLFIKNKFDWRGPRESIQFIARKHFLFLLVKCLAPFIFGLFSLVFTGIMFFNAENKNFIYQFIFLLNLVFVIGWFIWIIVDWANDFSIITNRRAVSLEKVALFYEKRQEAPLEAIISVETKTGQVGRILGYGNIIIRTFTGTLTFKNLANPDLVVKLINEERNRSKVLNKKTQRNYKEDTIRQRLGKEKRKYDPFEDKTTDNTTSEATATVKSGILTEWLSDIFRLRSEENGIITYRTHWFILLRKTIIPSLIIVLLFIMFLLNVAKLFTPLPLPTFTLILVIISFFIFLWWLYLYFDWRNDRYIVTHDQVIDIFKKPLGTEQKRSAPLKNIQTVEFERLGLISLILNFGTVYIRVGDTTFTFDYVYNPSEAQKEIFGRYQEFVQKQVETERERLRQEMADWIEIYHQVIQNGGTPPPPPSPQNFSEYNIEENL